MPELITIPIAVVEIEIQYARPNMRLLADRMKVVSELFDAFARWNIKIDDVDVLTEGKPSEQGIKFKIPAKRTTFFFGAGSCKFTRDDADWESAEESIEILDAGWRVLKEVGDAEAGVYKTTIALHLQPKTLPYIEILKPFASSPLARLESSPMKAVAAVLKWSHRRVTLDGSGQLANGVFLRFEREFEGKATYSEIATQLRKDEDELFALLDVKEDRQ